MLNWAMAGVGYTTCDLGGFSGSEDACASLLLPSSHTCARFGWRGGLAFWRKPKHASKACFQGTASESGTEIRFCLLDGACFAAWSCLTSLVFPFFFVCRSWQVPRPLDSLLPVWSLPQRDARALHAQRQAALPLPLRCEALAWELASAATGNTSCATLTL